MTTNPVDCGICYTPIEDDYLKTACNHEYHKECLAYALKKNNNNECPYCRKIINIPGVSIEKTVHSYTSYSYTPATASNCSIPGCPRTFYDQEKNPNLHVYQCPSNTVTQYKKICHTHAQQYLNTARCCALMKSGINKGEFCDKRLYKIIPITEDIVYKNKTIKSDFTVCKTHYKYTPEMLKEYIKKETEKEAKAQAKLEKEKAKAMNTSDTSATTATTATTDAETSAASTEGKCKYILTRGENKGKNCTSNGIYDGYCKRHCPADKLQAILNKITN